MSKTQSNRPPDVAVRAFNERYRTGPDRYANWAADKLPVAITDAQRRVLRAVATNRRVLLIGANGPGKTYSAVILTMAFHNTNRPSTVLATSGTYGKLRRTLCRPLKAIYNNDDLPHQFPGVYKHSPPRIDTDDPEWYFEAARPKDAEELEGTHNEHLLAITEEADKPAVDEDVIESMDSCLTDANDRHLVIANPPRDESNSVYELEQSDKWHTVRLATWDSRNVRVDVGEHDGPKVPGLLGLSEVRDKWEEWNGEPWPGFETAQKVSTPTSEHFRGDLDERWYRRRVGIMPPATAAVHRPFYADDVRACLEENGVPDDIGQPVGIGIDVAHMGGDETVVAILYQSAAEIHAWDHANHETNKARCHRILDGVRGGPPIAVDAVGEGSGLADNIQEQYGAIRFKNGEKAVQSGEYDNRWTEALAHFGSRLPSIAIIDAERKERKELYTAARTLEYERRVLKSGDVLRATAKSELKSPLERSPDRLDALVMAAWVEKIAQSRRGKNRSERSGSQLIC